MGIAEDGFVVAMVTELVILLVSITMVGEGVTGCAVVSSASVMSKSRIEERYS